MREGFEVAWLWPVVVVSEGVLRTLVVEDERCGVTAAYT